MADDEKPRGILKIMSGPKVGPKNPPIHLLPSKPMRTQEELTPIAKRIAENAALMERFRGVVGSGDLESAGSVVDEVREYAQALDPTITHPEGTRIVVVLMGMIGHPKESG